MARGARPETLTRAIGPRVAWPATADRHASPRADTHLLARLTVYLYAAGGTLALATLALPASPRRNEVGLVVLAAVAYALAAAVILVFERLNPRSFELTGAAGTILVTLALYFLGDSTGPYLLFYVWVGLFVFFFFPRRRAFLQLAFVGAAYGSLIAVRPPPDSALVNWVMLVGTLAVGGLLVSFMTDRVETMLARERQAEARFRDLVEQVPLVIYVDALDEQSSNVYTSPQIEPILGYSTEEWVSDPALFRKLLHPDDRDRVMNRVTRDDLDTPWCEEYRLIARDGRVVWFHDEAVTVRDENGKRLYSQGYLLDITARKEAEEMRGRLAAIVESSDDAIFAATLDGTIVSWNVGAERMYGYGADEITGQSVALLTPPERGDEMHLILSEIRRGAGMTQFETVRLRKDGSPFDVSLTVSPLRDASGEVTGVSTIQRDITERRRAETERELLLGAERAARTEAELARQKLAEQNERLRELDRLKDEFVALVSHELRTPLTSIRGYLAMLLAGRAGELAERPRRFLEVIDRNSDRLLRLVSDLLFFTQAGAGKLSLDLDSVDLDQLAEESVEAAKPAADQKGIALELVGDGLPPLEADRARVGQLLDNLLSNAIKFTPQGGRVQVSTASSNGHVVVAVSDTGMGIPAAEQEHLFERFFRSSAANEQAIPGTGLGLAIAKAIAEGHGGAIEVESEEGTGTTFRVILPRRHESGEVGLRG